VRAPPAGAVGVLVPAVVAVLPARQPPGFPVIAEPQRLPGRVDHFREPPGFVVTVANQHKAATCAKAGQTQRGDPPEGGLDRDTVPAGVAELGDRTVAAAVHVDAVAVAVADRDERQYTCAVRAEEMPRPDRELPAAAKLPTGDRITLPVHGQRQPRALDRQHRMACLRPVAPQPHAVGRREPYVLAVHLQPFVKCRRPDGPNNRPAWYDDRCVLDTTIGRFPASSTSTCGSTTSPVATSTGSPTQARLSGGTGVSRGLVTHRRSRPGPCLRQRPSPHPRLRPSPYL
jgi:hypothetical protein